MLALLAFAAQSAMAFNPTELASARYSSTAMAAVSEASYIEQVFVAEGSTRPIRVRYRNGRDGSDVQIVMSDTETIDVRKDPSALKALRSALLGYLGSKETNERAVVDICSALTVINEPSVRVFSVVWLGSRGKPLSPELGRIEDLK